MAMTVNNYTVDNHENVDFEEAARIYNEKEQEESKLGQFMDQIKKEKEELKEFELFEKKCALHTKNRWKHIVDVDMKSALKSVLQVEKMMSNDVKKNKLPTWAVGAHQRLDVMSSRDFILRELEEKMNTEYNASINSSDVQEEHMVAKLKYELGSGLQLTTTAIETKSDNINLELNRLQKLLELRPTTTELQKIQMTANNTHSKLTKTFQNISKMVKEQVKNSIAEELSCVLNNLKTNTTSMDSSVKNTEEKLNKFVVDLIRLQKIMITELDTEEKNTDNLQNSVNTVDEKYVRCNDYQTQQVIENDSGVKAQTRIREKMNRELTSHIEYVAEDLIKLDCNINKNKNKIEKSLLEWDNIMQFIHDTCDAKTKEIYEIRTATDVILKPLKIERSSSLLQYDSFIEKQKEIEEYIMKLQANDEIGRLDRNDDIICDHTAQNQNFEARLQFERIGNDKALKKYNDMDKEIDVYPAILSAINKGIDEATAKQNKSIKNLEEVRNGLMQVHVTLDELLTSRQEIKDIVKQGMDTNDDITILEKEIVKMQLKKEGYTVKLADAFTTIETNGTQLYVKMEDIGDPILELLNKKQSEIDEKIMPKLLESIHVISVAKEKQKKLNRNISQGLTGLNSSNDSENDAYSRPGTTGVAVAAKAKDEFATNEMYLLAKFCMDYEDLSVRKATVRDIPDDVCVIMSVKIQNYCKYLADNVDSELVQRVLRNDPSEYQGAESGFDMRERRVREFINGIEIILQTKSGASPSGVRLKARQTYLASVNKAFDIFMSKHSQVIVVQSSCMGRLKIPTYQVPVDRFIAYNEKLKSTIGDVAPSDEGFMDELFEGNETTEDGNIKQSQHQINQQQFLQQQQQKIDQPNVKIAANKNSKLPSLYKISLSDPSGLLSRPTTSSNKDAAYILRGGFKMPSAQLASAASLVEIQKANTCNLESYGPLLSRSESLPNVNNKNNPSNNNSNIL